MDGLNFLTLVAVMLVGLIVYANLIMVTERKGERDPKRRFTGAVRAEVLRRCGGRCEHVNIFGIRCSQPATQIDHAFPHSKGGPTALSNAVGLCAHHNRIKSDILPSAWWLKRIERSRGGYYPPGVDTRIRWNSSLR